MSRSMVLRAILSSARHTRPFERSVLDVDLVERARTAAPAKELAVRAMVARLIVRRSGSRFSRIRISILAACDWSNSCTGI